MYLFTFTKKSSCFFIIFLIKRKAEDDDDGLSCKRIRSDEMHGVIMEVDTNYYGQIESMSKESHEHKTVVEVVCSEGECFWV